MEADVWAAAQDVLREEKSRVMQFDLTEESMAEGGLLCGGTVEIFVEPVLPIPEMVIFGAGHISTQVSKIAVIAGFRTTIVDNRPVYANKERFPEAETVYSNSFEESFEALVDHPIKMSLQRLELFVMWRCLLWRRLGGGAQKAQAEQDENAETLPHGSHLWIENGEIHEEDETNDQELFQARMFRPLSRSKELTTRGASPCGNFVRWAGRRSMPR